MSRHDDRRLADILAAAEAIAAVARIQHATQISLDQEGRGTAYALLARAAGVHGDADLFDHAVETYRDLPDHASVGCRCGETLRP